MLGNSNTFAENVLRGSDKDTYRYGRYLPLFSELPNRSFWINKMADKYKEDMAMFGYSYYIDEDNKVFATCQDYDTIGNCV